MLAFSDKLNSPSSALRLRIIMKSPHLLQYFGDVSFKNLLTVQYVPFDDFLCTPHLTG